MGIKVITQPTEEPISIVEARLHLRLDAYDSPATHPDDALVVSLISAAREWAEKFTGRTIAVKTLELALDSFLVVDFPLYGRLSCSGHSSERLPWTPGREVELLRGPVQSITSVVYMDADGVEQTIDAANYMLDEHSDPEWWLLPADAYEWPATNEVGNVVKVRYVAGYTMAGDSPDSHPLPKAIKQALLLLIGHWYESRETSSVMQMHEIPLGAESLLRQYKVEKGMA